MIPRTLRDFLFNTKKGILSSMNFQDNKQQILKRFKEIDIIYREPARFLRPSTDFYCDIKKAYGYPDILNGLADLIGEKLQEEENCIAVSGYGGLPLGAAVA